MQSQGEREGEMEGHSSTLTFLFSTTNTNILLLLLMIMISNYHIQPAVSSSSAATAKALKHTYLKFINTSCNIATLTYHKLCYKTLSPYAAYVQTNPWNLCNASVTATINASGAVYATVSNLTQTKKLTSQEAGVIQDCIGNIEDSIYQLQQTLQAIAGLDGISADDDYQMANIETWLSAALTDDTTCTDGFVGVKVRAGVKKQIKKAISNFSRLTSNALALVKHLLN